jgi:molybdopterin converting factor small subunit
MTSLTVQLFASIRDAAGREEVVVDLPEDASAADLKGEIARQMPAVEPHMESAAVVINHRVARPHDPIRPGDEVALLPPVSGG